MTLLGIYRRALTIVLSTVFWKLCSVSLFELLVVVHIVVRHNYGLVDYEFNVKARNYPVRNC